MNSVAASDLSQEQSTLVDVMTTGESMRRLRESQGLTTAEVSARLKFSARQIEALEAEEWDKLPKGLPLRGLIRNYGRLLGTDPDALLSALEQSMGTATAGGELAGRELAAGAAKSVLHPDSDPGVSHGSWGWMIIILIVLGVAVAYAFGQGWLPQEWLPTGWFS